MTITEFEQSYLRYNRISPARSKEVVKTLDEIDAWLPTGLEQIDAEGFRGWMGELLDRGYHVNTVRKKGNMVRSYVRYGWQRGEIDGDRYLRIRAVANPRGASGLTKPRPYTRDEVTAIYRWIDETHPRADYAVVRFTAGRRAPGRLYNHLQNIQLHAVVALALECGLRRHEIAEASVDDISSRNEQVIVRWGKGQIDGEPRYREVPFTDNARKAIAEWLLARLWLWPDSMPPHNSPWVVLATLTRPVGRIGEPLTIDGLYRNLRPWSLHRMRHTCATMRVRAGMPIEVLSRFLGHSSVQQTLCYVELNRTDILRHSEYTEKAFAHLIGPPT